MAWRVIKLPDGRYSRFSEVVDSFTNGPLTEQEAFSLCRELGMDAVGAKIKVARAEHNPGWWPEACLIVKHLHGDQELQEILDELEVPQSERTFPCQCQPCVRSSQSSAVLSASAQ